MATADSHRETASNRLLAFGGKKNTSCEVPFLWRTQTDSNRQPSESESDALSSCAMGAYRRFCFVCLNYSTFVRISKPNAEFSACNILVTYRYVDDIIISTTKFGLNRVGKTDFTIN